MGNNRFYPDAQTLDLREEFAELVDGSMSEPGIGRPAIIRELTDTRCVCWDPLTGSADESCTFCDGETNQFTERVITVYIVRNFGSVLNPANVITRQSHLTHYGYTDENRALAFVHHFTFPNYERYTRPDHPSYDKLYELKVNSDGSTTFPNIRLAKWKIRSVTPHHGDFGRVEFFELGLEKEFA